MFISCLLVIDVGYLFCFIGGGLLVCGWSVWGGLVGVWALLCVVVCLGVGFACACVYVLVVCYVVFAYVVAFGLVCMMYYSGGFCWVD